MTNRKKKSTDFFLQDASNSATIGHLNGLRSPRPKNSGLHRSGLSNVRRRHSYQRRAPDHLASSLRAAYGTSRRTSRSGRRLCPSPPPPTLRFATQRGSQGSPGSSCSGLHLRMSRLLDPETHCASGARQRNCPDSSKSIETVRAIAGTTPTSALFNSHARIMPNRCERSSNWPGTPAQNYCPVEAELGTNRPEQTLQQVEMQRAPLRAGGCQAQDLPQTRACRPARSPDHGPRRRVARANIGEGSPSSRCA